MNGIDVSYFQGSIDWNRVKSYGIDFVIPRTGYGVSTTDRRFYEYVKGATSAGIKIEGVYHFSYALNTTNAITEANLACDIVERAGLPKTTIIFYDFEYDTVDYAKKNGIYHNANTCTACTKAFCDTVKSRGFVPGVYANVDYWNNYYKHGDGIPSDAIFWLADWTKNPKQELLNRATFHQTSEKGIVTGINGNVDLDKKIKNVEVKEYKKLTDEEIIKIATDVLDNKYGTGEERKKKLEAEGYDYTVIQNKVNQLIEQNPEKTNKKAIDQLVTDIFNGLYGNGEERKKKLEAEGYDYTTVQNAVNKALSHPEAVSEAKSFDKKYNREFTINATALNIRYIPGLLSYNNVTKILTKGTKVRCWGYYTEVDGKTWLLIQNGNDVGYAILDYLK